MGKKLYRKLISFAYLYPLLFAVYPLLALYTSNIEKLRYVRIIQPLEISIAFTIGLWLLLNTLLRNKYKTSLLVTYFLLLFYSYGHVYNTLEWLIFNNTEIENNIGLFSLWVILLIIGGYLIVLLQKDLTGITKTISKIGIFLILIPTFQIIYFNINFNRILSSDPVSTEIAELIDSKDPTVSLDHTTRPDIYYIILDAYASNEVLKNIFSYDNIEFTRFLESKGFKVAPQARSNYSQTALSLSSSLNMKYINYLVNSLGENSINRVVLTNMIKDNQVFKFLKSEGYKTINFSSGWSATDRNRFADINVFCVRGNDVSTNLLLTTMLRPFENMFMNENKRQRVLCTFSRLANINKEVKGPIFTLAHIVFPHPPFIFGPNGESVDYSKIKNGDDYSNKEGYINQVKFVNKEVEKLVRKLTTDKSHLPIIVIQADHGSASTPGLYGSTGYYPQLVQERMRPMVATLLPGKNNFIPDSVTPVNIFRLIFNNYFNTKYQILENKIYFSTYAKPYKFVDVTETVWKLPPK